MSRGSPDRIQIVELKLIQNAGYLKDIIYGNHEDAKYDGIHLNGKEATGHFSYRAVQAIYPVLYKPNDYQKWRQTKDRTQVPAGDFRSDRRYNYHDSCPQAAFMRQSAAD